MKFNASFVRDIRLSYKLISSTLTVTIGSFVIGACAVAKAAVPFDNGSLEAMSPFHSELVTESRFPAGYSDFLFKNALLEKWNAELDELTILEEDWDGEGSAAVQPQAVRNCRDILHLTSFALSELQEIYPTPFGSICMEWSHGDGYVNAEIASSGMAFFHKYGNRNEAYLHEFSPLSDEILNDLKANLS